MRKIFVICLLAAGWIAVLSDSRVQQFGIGKELVLKPVDPPVPITSITWKHNGNLVAEWIKDQIPLDYLGAYKGRTLLDLNTGKLKLSNMKKDDEGEFVVEINNKVQNVRFTAKEIKPVPEPQAFIRPLTCSSSSETCQLICEAKDNSDITGSEPIQYFWKEENGPWKNLEKKYDITNNEETQRVETFYCQMKNQISEKESPAVKNPFYIPSGPNITGVVVGVLFGILALVLAVVGFLKKEKIMSCFKRRNENKRRNGESPENNALKSNSEDKNEEGNIGV